MSPLTLRLVGAIAAHLGPRDRTPARMCEMGEPGHSPVPLTAVDRHRTGGYQCPACAAPVDAIRLGGGKVLIPAHKRLPSVTVRTVRTVTRG